MCPKCRSQRLKIKRARGLEFLAFMLTGKRKYHCQDCGNRFRAPDRRSVPRPEESI